MSGGATQVSTSTTEPWEAQQEFLTRGFESAANLYDRGAPKYYGKETLAGFDPATTFAQTSTLGYAGGPRAAAQQAAAENRLIQGLGAEIDTARFDPMMDYLGRQMKSNLETNVLPGIRESLVKYQPGGSTRGDLVQARAISDANQQMLDKAAQMTYDAYTGAQDRALRYGSLYPTIMGAPLSMYEAMSGVGDQRRAMTQATIDRDMARYEYEANAPQNALRNYMAMVSGDYGSTTTQTTPGPSGLSQLGQIAGIAGSLAPYLAPSDARLKDNVTLIGKEKGYNVYIWEWNDKAKELGIDTPTIGVIAQEVLETNPDAVSMNDDGYYQVNYGAL